MTAGVVEHFNKPTGAYSDKLYYQKEDPNNYFILSSYYYSV
jgi:hypothetical protein